MSPATNPRKGKPPASLADEKSAEKPSAAFYNAHPAGKEMELETIKLGFWATNREMGQLWTSIETEMDARQVLVRNINGKGALADLQAKRLEAVEAGIDGVAHFNTMMGVINGHQHYKKLMCLALRSKCLHRWRIRKKPPGTPASATNQGCRRRITAKPRAAPTSAPATNPKLPPTTLEKELPDVTLGSHAISIGINGVDDMAGYLPLHLIQEDAVLNTLHLLSDDMKARVQPEDLSFDQLKDLVSQDCAIDSVVSVTCLELQRSITNDRSFQTAIHVLLERGSKLNFMFSDSELVSLKIPTRSSCPNDLTLNVTGTMIPDSTIAVNNWRDIDESANLDLLGRCAPVFGSTLPFTQAGRQPRRSNSLWRSANELGILLYGGPPFYLD